MSYESQSADIAKIVVMIFKNLVGKGGNSAIIGVLHIKKDPRQRRGLLRLSRNLKGNQGRSYA
jgi:hypothetical protein